MTPIDWTLIIIVGLFVAGKTGDWLLIRIQWLRSRREDIEDVARDLDTFKRSA